MAEQFSYDGFISYSHAADGLLAPRLQAGLQRFAKAWWKRRALRLFRDESSLSANPHLWSSITEALDQSGWFVLLLSPDAAQSEWVGQEIGYWTTNRDAGRILPVVTDGEFGWSDGDVVGDAVPAALKGVFAEEPRWVDLRWAKDEDQLDLQDPRFADAVADIGSALRGIPKDELASEEVRQHRRTVRTAWAGGVALAALTVLAGVLAVQSTNNAAEAERQAELATENAAAEAAARELADDNARRAQANAEAEAAARDETEVSRALAASRELAASSVSVLDVDPELAVLLGLQAIRSAPDTDSPPIEAKIALREAVQSSRLISRFDLDVDGEILFGDLSRDGSTAIAVEDESVRLLDLATGETLWIRPFSEMGGLDGSPGSICPVEAYFSPSGAEIAVGLVDGTGTGCFADIPEGHLPASGLAVLDVVSGDIVRSSWVATCPDLSTGGFSPDGALISLVVPADGDCEFGTPLDWTIRLVDSVTFEPVLEIPVPDFGMTSWSADGALVSIGSFFGLGAVVYDTSTGEEVSVMDDEFFLGFLSPDGSRLAGSDIDSTVIEYNVETANVIDRLPDLGDGPLFISWSDDGSRLVAAGEGPQSVVWDAASGQVEVLIPNTGPSWMVRFDDEADRLVHFGIRDVSIWDLSGDLRAASNTSDIDAAVQANSLTGGPGGGAFLFRASDGQWHVGSFDTASGELGPKSLPVEMGRRTAVLEDGRVAVFLSEGLDQEQVVGPVALWDPQTGSTEPLWGCEASVSDLSPFDAYVPTTGPCLDGTGEFFDHDRVLLSEDRSRLAVTSRSGELLLFDPTTLELLESTRLPDGALALKDVGATWLATSNIPTTVGSPLEEISIWSFPDLELIARVDGGWVQSNPTGTLLAVAAGPGHVSVLDTSTGETVVEFDGGEGRIRGLAFSPDGTLFMSSATDGFVRIWSVQSGAELERIPLAGDSGDGYWIDDDTIAIATFEGLWANIDISLDSLLTLARERLLRSFTPEECSIYRIDPCPSLEELRGA